jgi:hypothetical protein
MPSDRELPEDLKSLAFRNALRVDSGADFHHHIDRLCSSLQSTPASPPPIVSGSPPPPIVSGLRQSVTSTSSPPRIDQDPRRKNLRKILLRLALCILTPILFFFLGIQMGWVAFRATHGTPTFLVGAVPVWLFGMWLIYFLWRRIR